MHLYIYLVAQASYVFLLFGVSFGHLPFCIVLLYFICYFIIQSCIYILTYLPTYCFRNFFIILLLELLHTYSFTCLRSGLGMHVFSIDEFLYLGA